MENGLKTLVGDYLNKCNKVIESNNRDNAKELETELVATFEGYINGFDKGLDYDIMDFSGYGTDHYGDYVKNIKKLKCKLDAFLATGCLPTTNLVNRDNNRLNVINNNSSSNNNTNTLNNNLNINIETLFKEAIREIEDNESLSEEDIGEVLAKIKEIENISKSNENKNKKWFKLRPTMEWLGTKGVSVATSILGLITAILKTS